MKTEKDQRLDAPEAAVTRHRHVSQSELRTAHPVASDHGEGSHEKHVTSARHKSESAPQKQTAQTPEPQKPVKRPEFKGYTLDEIRMRKVINELKIDIAKERIRNVVSPQAAGESNPIKSCVRGFDNMMRYFNIAMLAFGISRRLFGFLRRFSRRR